MCCHEVTKVGLWGMLVSLRRMTFMTLLWRRALRFVAAAECISVAQIYSVWFHGCQLMGVSSGLRPWPRDS